jgi:hypothetical protein
MFSELDRKIVDIQLKNILLESAVLDARASVAAIIQSPSLIKTTCPHVHNHLEDLKKRLDLAIDNTRGSPAWEDPEPPKAA